MKFFKSLYLTNRLFAILGITALILFAGFIYDVFFAIGKVCVLAAVVLFIADIVLLFLKGEVTGTREVPEKLSNGDENEIKIHLENLYPFKVEISVIDELPFQFQIRDFLKKLSLEAGKKTTLKYSLKPVKRGEYIFGSLNLFITSPIGLIKKRFKLETDKNVRVYPSFLQLRKFELLAISNRLHEVGVKKLRKLGRSMEFEKIRDYVMGDDYRTINWKATARKSSLMVNQFEDEKSQQVFCIIDKGRTMKMPFENMSLLDYSINASLVLSGIALHKQDKAGLITFSDKAAKIVAPDKKKGQIQLLLEVLYNEKTNYLESDFEKLFGTIYRKVNQRSLLILFTNFESLFALQRQLPHLKKLAQKHLLLIIFFENTELTDALLEKPSSTEEFYIKTITEQIVFEKRQMVKELENHGIQAILTSPAQLSINTINKYLEIKSRGMI